MTIRVIIVIKTAKNERVGVAPNAFAKADIAK
jgi:hypothetical protein